MKVSRSKPGFVVSSVVHAGLLVAALTLFSDAQKYDDAQEMIPVEVITDSQLNQLARGEKRARDLKPSPRVDKVAAVTEAKPQPPLSEAKKDTPTPPPPLRRMADPGSDDKPEPTPPKRVAALPPAPEPPARPQPEKKIEKPAEPKPVEAKPTPPAKPKAAALDEKAEPEDAEVVKPKPPTRPKPEKDAKETQKPAPEKPKTEPRLTTDEVAKLLESKKLEDKPAQPENPEGETADRAAKGAKPKSGDETAPKSKFDAESISNLLSRETPQRRAATGDRVRTASLGASDGTAPKLSASMEARIASYIHDHYHPCWASALSLGGETYKPVVEFHLSREGELEGRPRLLNGSAQPTEKARGEQALQAVRRCSPMKIPSEFMPYYDEALHEVTIRFQDAN